MSASSEPAERRMTVAEFLAWDDGTGTRYELVDGLLVAMNPPTPRHTEICENLGRALERQVRPPCRVYRAALGVALAETGRDWREPDLIVTCTRPEGGFYAAPRLMVEVLSPSTEKDDRTTKLDFYERFASLEAILLVWQDERRVRLRLRGDGRWVDQDTIGSGTVLVPGLEVELKLDEIYADPWGEDEG
jgi:Uma2 family endonuclease